MQRLAVACVCCALRQGQGMLLSQGGELPSAHGSPLRVRAGPTRLSPALDAVTQMGSGIPCQPLLFLSLRLSCPRPMVISMSPHLPAGPGKEGESRWRRPQICRALASLERACDHRCQGVWVVSSSLP